MMWVFFMADRENEELQASKSSALEKLEHAHEELVTLQEQVDGSVTHTHTHVHTQNSDMRLYAVCVI